MNPNSKERDVGKHPAPPPPQSLIAAWRTNTLSRILSRCVCGCQAAFFGCTPTTLHKEEDDDMKRSASACFDKEGSSGAEHMKKITKSVQPKKSTTKLHDDVDEYPSPIRVKKESNEVPQPLVPLTVNEAPTAKELAAAKAARIRLGYETADPKTLNSDEPGNETPLKCPTGPEPSVAVEVEYIPTEELKPLTNVEETVNSVLLQLNSKDWIEMCTALNTVRRLTVHHPSECLTIMPSLVPAVLKLIKNPRSSVCKTAVLCLADLLHSQKDAMLPYLDEGGLTRPSSSVLCQLFLKASSDKRFVVDEVQKVLTALGRDLDTMKLIEMVMPYASEHKNPKVRGKAGAILATVTERMTASDWKKVGIPLLLKAAGVLITDKTPEAREAARIMILKIHAIFLEEQTPSTEGVVDAAVTVNVSVVSNNAGSMEAAMKQQVEEEEEEPYLSDSSEDDEAKEPPPPTPWQLFCEEHLTTTQAIAVTKIQPTSGSK